MRFTVRLALASLGLALASPLSAMADDAPLSRSAAASSSTSTHKHKHKHSLFGGKQQCAACAAKAAKAAGSVSYSAPAAGDVAAAPRHCPHMANGVCLECSSKLAIVAPEPVASAKPAYSSDMKMINRTAVPDSLAGGQVISCAHQRNGVCRECKALLEMPGQVTVVSQRGAAAGRAVASDMAPGRALVQAGEPEPIGVMRTNYNVPQGPAAAAAPGRAIVNGGNAVAGNGGGAAMPSAPYLPARAEGSPHIIGHLFGISEIRNDFQDWMSSKSRQKKDAHAAIPYGPAGGSVDELPASMVYGKSAH